MPTTLFKTPTHSANFKPIDIFAGLSVAGILVPEALAYASIAHLSIQAGISALLLGLLCYALFGSSRFAIVSPTSSSATLVAAAALSLNPTGSTEQAAFSFALIILTGLGLITVAFAGLGRLSAFVSRPVLVGFSFALAITIIIKQLPIMAGVTAHGPNPFVLLTDLVDQSAKWSWWSLLSGIGALVILTSIRRFTKLPAAFIVLTIGIMLSYIIDLSTFHITIVGPVELIFPHIGPPTLSIQKWLDAAALAGGLVVIVFSESWGSIRGLANLHGDRVEPNRELFSLGVANIASGLVQGMPVGAGFSASVANESSGGQSKWSGFIAALSVLGLSVFGQPLIEHIPLPILAATVIGALLHALNPKPLIAFWRMNRDQYLSLAAVVSVLFFGVLHGMLFAVALSIASAIRTFIQPSVQELTELDSTRNYVDLKNHPDATPHEHLLILRPEEPLFFASVEGIVDVIKTQLQARSDCKILIISLEQSNDLDSTATDNLIELVTELKKKNIITLLARVKDPVRALLIKLAPDLFQEKLFWSVADAAKDAEHVLSTS